MKKTTNIILIIATSLIVLFSILAFLDEPILLIPSAIYLIPYLILWLFNRRKETTTAANWVLFIAALLAALPGVFMAFATFRGGQIIRTETVDMADREAMFGIIVFQYLFVFAEGFVAILGGIIAVVIDNVAKKKALPETA